MPKNVPGVVGEISLISYTQNLKNERGPVRPFQINFLFLVPGLIGFSAIGKKK